MLKGKPSINLVVMVLAASVLAGLATCSKAKNNVNCKPSSCGKIRNISYPFRLKGDPTDCGEPEYELTCENNRTILNFESSRKFYVQGIRYKESLIRVVDPGLDKANCSSFPINTLQFNELEDMADHYRPRAYSLICGTNIPVFFISCAAPARSPPHFDIRAFCRDHMPNWSSSSPMNNYSCLLVGNIKASVLEDSCAVKMVAWMMDKHFGRKSSYTSLADVYDALAYGFFLDWRRVSCKRCPDGSCHRGGTCVDWSHIEMYVLLELVLQHSLN